MTAISNRASAEARDRWPKIGFDSATGLDGLGGGAGDVAQLALAATALKLSLKGFGRQFGQRAILLSGEKFRGAMGGDGNPDDAAVLCNRFHN